MMRKISLFSIILISCTLMVQATKIRLFNKLNDEMDLNFWESRKKWHILHVLSKDSFKEFCSSSLVSLHFNYKDYNYNMLYCSTTGIFQVRYSNKFNKLLNIHCKNIGANKKVLQLILHEDDAGHLLFATE